MRRYCTWAVFCCVLVCVASLPQQKQQSAVKEEEEEGNYVAEKVSYRSFQLWTAYPQSEEQKEFLQKVQTDYGVKWGDYRSHETTPRSTFMVPPDFQIELRMRLEDESIPFNVTIADVQEAINNENPEAESNIDELEYRQGHRMDWTSYHRLSDIHGYLDYLAISYPNYVTVQSIGKSGEGRDLKLVKISSGGKVAKKAIWIDGGIHAREWMSPAVVTYIIHKLVEYPENRKLFDSIDWYILPVSNPDGYEYTHTVDRLWRKTRSRGNRYCQGADPNRNFAYQWCGLGTSRDPCSEVFCGNSAFSEPETKAMSNFILSKIQQLKAYLTIHSYGQYWLIPWGYDVQYPEDYDDLKAVAQKSVSAMKAAYTVGNSAKLLYPAAGGSDDWAKSVGVKYSYTIELPDTGRYGFVMPSSQITPVCEDFFPAIATFAREMERVS